MIASPTCKDCGAEAKRKVTGEWTCTSPGCCNYHPPVPSR